MQQKQKAPKQFSISDDEMQIPFSFLRTHKIPKLMRSLQEPQDPYQMMDRKQNSSKNQSLVIPYHMSLASIKCMLFHRITAYLCAVSMLLSIVSLYGGYHEQILVLINNGITVGILFAIFLTVHFFNLYKISKKQIFSHSPAIMGLFGAFLTLPHPTLWTQDFNNILHLMIMFRILIIFNYAVFSSLYCDVRAYRIIKLNGLSSDEHFLFALKSITQRFNFPIILIIQIGTVLWFTHCLYLVSQSDDSFQIQWLDCLEIVTESVATFGFGEYDMHLTGQKVILVFCVIIGAVMNSFITLSMVNHLKMNTFQLSSYWLMKKLSARQHIESLSKNYIQQSFPTLLKNSSESAENRQQINISFRKDYRLQKNLYHSISYIDINSLFAYFRQSLTEMRISSAQTNNLINVAIQTFIKKTKIKSNRPRKDSLARIFDS